MCQSVVRLCNVCTTMFTRDTNKDIEHPICTCAANIACSRPRIGVLNDTERTNKFIDALSKVSLAGFYK